jgi:hypothetical protein
MPPPEMWSDSIDPTPLPENAPKSGIEEHGDIWELIEAEGFAFRIVFSPNDTPASELVRHSFLARSW